MTRKELRETLARESFAFTKKFERQRGNAVPLFGWDDAPPKAKVFGYALADHYLEMIPDLKFITDGG